MGLVAEQDAFLMDVAKLIVKAHEFGFQVTAGEMWRTIEQQKLYVEQKRSRTMESKHLDRLAIDLNFFKEGKLAGTKSNLQALGDWWESLDPKNRWGGNFKSILDCPHFERNV